MPSSNVTHLQENGPAPARDLPTSKISITDRANGVWRFHHHVSAPVGSGMELVTEAVYYLEDDHDKADVVETFFEANPGHVPGDRTELGTFKQGLSGKWTDAVDAAYARVNGVEE